MRRSNDDAQQRRPAIRYSEEMQASGAAPNAIARRGMARFAPRTDHRSAYNEFIAPEKAGRNTLALRIPEELFFGKSLRASFVTRR
jgi:hypothetical protein